MAIPSGSRENNRNEWLRLGRQESALESGFQLLIIVHGVDFLAGGVAK
jgi:hypothetical protein